jgi:hypothetical protein
VQPAKHRARARHKSAEDHPQDEKRVQTEDENRERRIDAQSFMHYKKSIALPSLPIDVTPRDVHCGMAPTLFD